MSYFVIGIGGTGAKCIEALLHLCASGMIPKEKMYCLFVDPDRSNGNLERTKIILRHYQACNEIHFGNIPIFQNEITIGDPHVWSPFIDKQQPQLADFFEYATLKTKNTKAAHLFDVLYSENEKETSLEMGFRGHPSIGAAIMARTVKLGLTEPWKTLRNRIESDIKVGQDAKIFMFGSIFGGTGSSGFPTIARLIHNELTPTEIEHTRIGGALLLPYFTFAPRDKKDELQAISENFLLNTQMALQYYHNRQKQHDIIYLLGESEPNAVQYCLGSSEQKNDSHFIELYAALAALDFFKREKPTGFAMIARNDKNVIEWQDLPDGKNGNDLKKYLINLTRFAFAYLSVYLPLIEKILASGDDKLAPWYIEYFIKNIKDIDKSQMESQLFQMKKYCESLLYWIVNFKTSVIKQKVELVNYNPFAKVNRQDDKNIIELYFQEKLFSQLALPLEKDQPNELNKVWERMCDMKIRDHHSTGIGKFFQALYRACEQD